MEKWIKNVVCVFAIVYLCSCSTYNCNTQIPKEDEPVNPYSQEPVTDYGIADALRGVLNSYK